jgi:hypothetical protein
MTMTVFATQAPGLGSPKGPIDGAERRAPAGVTAQDRARAAFQDALRQKVGQRLERMKLENADKGVASMGSMASTGSPSAAEARGTAHPVRHAIDRMGAEFDGWPSDAAVFERPGRSARLGAAAEAHLLQGVPQGHGAHGQLMERVAPEARLLQGMPPRNLGGGEAKELNPIIWGGPANGGGRGASGLEPPAVQLYGLGGYASGAAHMRPGHAPQRWMTDQALDAGFEGGLSDAAVFERPSRLDRLSQMGHISHLGHIVRRAIDHGRAESKPAASAVEIREGAVGTRPAFGAGPLSLSVEGGRFSKAAIPGWARGYLRDGFGVGPNGELTEGGKIVVGKNGPIIVGRPAPDAQPVRAEQATAARKPADALERLSRITEGVPLPLQFDEAGPAAQPPMTLIEEFLKLAKDWKDREIEKRGEEEEEDDAAGLPEGWLEVTPFRAREAFRAAQASNAGRDAWPGPAPHGDAALV